MYFQGQANWKMTMSQWWYQTGLKTSCNRGRERERASSKGERTRWQSTKVDCCVSAANSYCISPQAPWVVYLCNWQQRWWRWWSITFDPKIDDAITNKNALLLVLELLYAKPTSRNAANHDYLLQLLCGMLTAVMNANSDLLEYRHLACRLKYKGEWEISMGMKLVDLHKEFLVGWKVQTPSSSSTNTKYYQNSKETLPTHRSCVMCALEKRTQTGCTSQQEGIKLIIHGNLEHQW